MTQLGMSPILADDPRLAMVADQLAHTQMASVVCDANWRLGWVSDELKELVGEEDEGKLGYGKHMVQCWLTEVWSSAITEESRARSGLEAFPIFAWDTPGGLEQIGDWIGDFYGPEMRELARSAEPVPPPAMWFNSLDYVQGDLPPEKIFQVFVRLHDHESNYFGNAILYANSLPATLSTLVARGDRRMFERMARLFEPGRRSAAILFADLETSASVARHLSSAAYFQLVRAITTKIDEVVITREGIVGKHAGDGVTAFFLTSDSGSPSATARSAITAAREIDDAVKQAAEAVQFESGSIQIEEIRMNVGVHWGPNLFMGQLVTGGRLEVTALGDEVNECARIQQSASGGEAFASKALVEQLDPSDASILEIDPETLRYQTIEELPGATDKARRDAGGIPVTSIKATSSKS